MPLGASGGWGLVAWEQTLGDLLPGAGYGCAAYGKWHLGEGPQEREPLDLPFMHSWTVTHFNRLLGEFQASIEREPPGPCWLIR